MPGVMFPREHGAYAQLLFPMVTALIAAGATRAGLAIALALVAGFLSHEPALILLGHRGTRAKRDRTQAAVAWLAVTGVVMVVSAGIAAASLDPPLRWSLGVPLAPAVILVGAMIAGRERSWYGELALALMCSGAAVPIAHAAGATWAAAAGMALPFAALYTSTTLAVRAVILKVRGGGDPAAAAATRRSALIFVVAAALGLALSARAGVLPPPVLAASAPGLMSGATLAWLSPSPARLWTIGWTILALSIVTSVLVIALDPSGGAQLPR